MATQQLQFSNPRHLNQLYVSKERNLKFAEESFGVEIAAREEWIHVSGDQTKVERAIQFFEILDAARSQGIQIKQSDFENLLNSTLREKPAEIKKVFNEPITIRVKRRSIVPKTINQKQYLHAIQSNEVVFGIGPAGTGKTYLAMAVALNALLEGSVEKLIITRPAVEAGEALGFLPGELEEKILPYLRPLYDAMYDMLGKEETMKIMERGSIEIAPLAYMRGRTLSNAFIILDEAQNTTSEQMMMFLTRSGDHSRMVITGDVTQVDLPRQKKSGLKQVMEVLKGIDGIKLFYLDESDVVRHPLVQKIIEAYNQHLNE
ncbi:MAG: PhoH family protein [Opitutales bacterium]|nr:PhoH family protein [Opitutales bacterium]